MHEHAAEDPIRRGLLELARALDAGEEGPVYLAEVGGLRRLIPLVLELHARVVDLKNRRPVGVALAPTGEIVVVCSDGSVFHELSDGNEGPASGHPFGFNRRWVEVPPIPGTSGALR